MKHGYVIVYLLVAAIGSSQQQPASQDTGKPGSISGTVRDARTGTPMAGAEVFAMGDSNKRVGAQTDTSGHYTLRDLQPGECSVSAMAPLSGGPPGPRPYASRPVTLAAGHELTSIDFRLEAFGKITGKVLDENDEPVTGVSVFLVAREYTLGTLRYVFAGMADTDDRGVYSLVNAPPGRAYLLYAWKINRQLKAVSDAPAEVRLRKRAVAPTFYPSSDSIEGAAPIMLRPGETREGVNIQVLRSASYCVESEAPSLGGENMMFTIAPAQPTSGMVGDGGFFTMPPTGKVGADRKLRLCDLSPGDYELTLTDLSHGPGGAPPYFGVTQFTINDRDLHGVAVNPRIPVKVPGEIVWDGTAPAEQVKSKLSFWLQPMTRSMMGEETSAQSSIPGEFSFPGLLVDGYRVTLHAIPQALYVKELTYGGANLLHIPLQPGSAVGEAHLRLVMGRDGGFLKAKVADKDSSPVADCFVILMPADALSETVLADEIIVGQTDQRGIYSSGALAPGKYYALVSPRPVNKSPEDMTKLLQSRSRAQVIEIGAGVTLSATLVPQSVE